MGSIQIKSIVSVSDSNDTKTWFKLSLSGERLSGIASMMDDTGRSIMKFANHEGSMPQ